MSKADINTLNSAIDRLKKRYDELDELSLSMTSFSQVDEILDNMDLIAIRMTRLRILRNHMSAAIIQVDPPNAADKKQLNDALKTLGQSIKKDQKWTAVRGLVKKILAAASMVKKNVEGRQHKDNA